MTFSHVPAQPPRLIAASSPTARARLTGRSALVVSGTKGIGAAVAEQLAVAGANVTIVGRSQADGAAVLAKLRALSAPDARHEFLEADLSSVRGALALAERFKATHAHGAQLQCLVFTVGILGRDEWRATPEGIEHEFQLNFFSRFVLLTELLPLLVSRRHRPSALA